MRVAFPFQHLLHTLLLGFLSCFAGVAFSADNCAGLTKTGILCRLATLSPEESVLPPRSAGAISAFVAATIKGEDLTTGAVELGLFTLLPQDVQESCKKLSKSDKLGAALICLRPACFSNSPAKKCEPLLR